MHWTVANMPKLTFLRLTDGPAGASAASRSGNLLPRRRRCAGHCSCPKSPAPLSCRFAGRWAGAAGSAAASGLPAIAAAPGCPRSSGAGGRCSPWLAGSVTFPGAPAAPLRTTRRAPAPRVDGSMCPPAMDVPMMSSAATASASVGESAIGCWQPRARCYALLPRAGGAGKSAILLDLRHSLRSTDPARRAGSTCSLIVGPQCRLRLLWLTGSKGRHGVNWCA